MSDPTPIRSDDYTVALDYGQFLLHTDDLEDFDLPVTLVERALAGDGIAQDGDVLLVCSPHQNNFEMPLRVETWAARPPDDLADWQEAFEAHLDVTSYGLLYESPTLEGQWLDVEPGSYHVEIAGRGFVAHGWPGSTTPGDTWRLRLWPDPTPAPARRLSRWMAVE